MKKLKLILGLLAATSMPAAMGCIPKTSLGISPDGQGGYLRPYMSSDKPTHPKLGHMGVEHCKPEGGKIVCKDLKVVISAP